MALAQLNAAPYGVSKAFCYTDKNRPALTKQSVVTAIPFYAEALLLGEV